MKIFAKRGAEKLADMYLKAKPGSFIPCERIPEWTMFSATAPVSDRLGNYFQISRKTFSAAPREANCKNCGAPVDGHKCGYCGTVHW